MVLGARAGVRFAPLFCSDSDDEAEGKTQMPEIVNEVVEEEKAAASEVSAENKAAQALDKVFTQDQETDSQEQMETESSN